MIRVKELADVLMSVNYVVSLIAMMVRNETQTLQLCTAIGMGCTLSDVGSTGTPFMGMCHVPHTKDRFEAFILFHLTTAFVVFCGISLTPIC